MKIASWNVNSLRAREDQVLDWLEAERPDVLCMQEIKMVDQEVPTDALGDLGYDVHAFGQRSYNGVAIACRDEAQDVVRGFPGDPPDAERRLLAATIGGIRIIDIYLPNGQELASPKYEYKLRWMEQLLAFLQAGPGPETPLLICGDFNIAPLDLDVWDGSARQGLFVSPPERQGFQRFLDWGLVDTFRHFHPNEPKAFTWWDYRAGGFERNKGMRIDHFLLTRPLLSRAKSIRIDRKVRANEQPSDHVPVILELD